eukprot:CAMPEP_0198728554 /NCGR_PEP_ID=MMETSP1475-20131203/9925_1 /TAXON_ID= ORGANISM="Unidentified sp., Strain CCMP1999" /NCGR_SAMPLE_ID=MMETSP1475 /ASSEMBLY_ACC=CAM_ASM_001111 /LENGTH=435 /DNA_ID=CAMNT_0044490953 /DNA_START=172 /DNA_END=1479 /DNA_ORIENTATION=+
MERNGESVESFEPLEETRSSEPSSSEWIPEEYEMSAELEVVFQEMQRVFGFERPQDGKTLSVNEELKRLLPSLQNVNALGRSHAIAALEERIDSSAEQIRTLQAVLKQAELRKFREEEDKQYLDLERKFEELKFDLVMTHREASELQTQAKETAFEVQRRRTKLEEKKAQEESLSKPRVNILTKRLEELPRELSRLRKDLNKVEDDLQKERFLQKDLTRNMEAAEGTKRRAEQMIQILAGEVRQMEEREREAEREAAEVTEAYEIAETEFETCRREASASTQELLSRMQELYDIQDSLLQEIKQHHENKVFKAIGARASQQALRMKHLLASLTSSREQTASPSKSNSNQVSESRRRVQELSRILSEKEEHTKALETKVDTLKQKLESTERRLELARQERVKNARSLGEDKVLRGGNPGMKGKAHTGVSKEFQWMN